jgi:hypothetical protein
MKRLILALGLVFGFSYALKPVESYVLNLPKQHLSSVEIKDLEHMREEEKLARDVYLTLYKKWHMPVFRNIAKSEMWHMHMIKLLLDKYHLPDPVAKTGDKVGVFEDRHLQNLYNELVRKGNKSLKDALIVGATIEDLDIKDLQEAISRTDNKDIKFVYSALKHGSENHMRAFVRTLRRFGGDYKPQYISESYFRAILNNKRFNSGFKLSEVKGKVTKVYTLPGLRKGVYWWMADVATNHGSVRVAIAPTWILNSANIKPGDEVEIKGYQGLYSFIVCSLEDKTSGFEYHSTSMGCRK